MWVPGMQELMEGRDLRSLLDVRNRSTKERLFGWYLRGKHVALDVAFGLAYLHRLSTDYSCSSGLAALEPFAQGCALSLRQVLSS